MMKRLVSTKEMSHRKETVRTITLIVVLIPLALVVFPYCGSLLMRGAFSIANPFWEAKREALRPEVGLMSLFTDKALLQKENEVLRKKLANYQALSLERERLQTENAILRGIEDSYASSSSHVIVPVLVYPDQSLYDTLIVDLAGIPEQFTQEHTWVYAEGIVIGSLSSVNGTKGKATLLSTNGNLVNALVGSSGISSALTGQGGGAFSMAVPLESDVREGDQAILPTAGGAIAALVSTVERNENAQEKQVRLRIPVNIYSLRFVELVP